LFLIDTNMSSRPPSARPKTSAGQRLSSAASRTARTTTTAAANRPMTSVAQQPTPQVAGHK
jgi:hypothetical protein